MDLCNFTSIFEIFCTIYLAYIVTDNFVESNFIATITEKILRKYDSIDSLFHDIDSRILGAETSLNNLELGKTSDDATQKEYNRCVQIVEIQKKKIVQYKKEIQSKIKGSYQTKSFSYISLYLALYCILILFFSGIQNHKDLRFENVLVMFIVFTFIFLCFGWAYDGSKPSVLNSIVCFFAKKLKLNGFIFTLNCLLFVIFLSVVAFLFPQIPSVYYKYYHCTIVVIAIFIPILNFIIYFNKASSRAETIRENLTEKVKSIADDVPIELKEIENLLIYFEVGTKITILQAISQNQKKSK